MLKNTPRLITIGLILLFSLPIAVQQFMYMLMQDRDIASSANSAVEARRTLKSSVEGGTRVFSWLERVDYDLQVTHSDNGAMSKDVAVIEIGEHSLKDLGQFPFTRTIYKTLIEHLEKAGAKVVAFDATFPEHDSRIELLTQLRSLRHEIEQREGFDSAAVKQIDARIFSIDADEDFATALHNAKIPVVLGFTLTDIHDNIAVTKEIKDLLFGYGMFRRNMLDTGSLTSYTGHTPVVSIVELMRSLNQVGSIGHINPRIDDDSVIRGTRSFIARGARDRRLLR